MNIHQSAEDYLESIYSLKKKLGNVRSIDIVNDLGFSKPSVSVAMKKLRENGYINMDANGYITLNPSGEEIATKIYTRHLVLTRLLESLGVDSSIAKEDACKLEHALSEESFNKIHEFVHSRD